MTQPRQNPPLSSYAKELDQAARLLEQKLDADNAELADFKAFWKCLDAVTHRLG